MNKKVTLLYDPTWQALYWAKKHCPSYVTSDIHQIGYNSYVENKIDYFFHDEKDAVFFTLRWA